MTHRNNWLLVRLVNPSIARLSNIGCNVAIPIPEEVEFDPMFLRRRRRQPLDCRRINILHSLNCIIELLFSVRACRFIQESAEVGVFVFFVHVRVQMSQAITVRTTGKEECNSLEEPFLAIGNESKCLRMKECWCMLANNIVEDGTKPKPVFIVLRGDNRVGEREYLPIGIDYRCRQ
jgi:hypothetical protein